jgi:hypothetical protein
LDTWKGWALRFPPTSQQFHTNIKFLLEVEQNNALLFLDVLVSRRPGCIRGAIQKFPKFEFCARMIMSTLKYR